MSEPAIHVERLGKRYRIGSRQRHVALRDAIGNALAVPVRALRLGRGLSGSNGRENTSGDMWALRDVSFEVAKGEVVGIIGRNGAGKSTLLKILSRITDPTEGRACIYGRVGSLLEVGTGFHPELTGRENVYLNGAILGMKKTEIGRKFDQIVAFAETERFIDTPVKHYSTGMYLRLAFAVAAHLEPEILLVDEVLAVGDAAFQKKCLGKMDDVAREGRTVIFVSHQMGAVTRLCRRGIWLDNGRVRLCGPIDEVVAHYLSSGSHQEAEVSFPESLPAPGNEKFRLQAVRVRSPAGAVSSFIDVRRPFFVEIEYRILGRLAGLRIGFRLLAFDGTVVFSSTDLDGHGTPGEVRAAGVFLSRCEIPAGLLNKGRYSITVGVDVPMLEGIVLLDNAVSFHVEPAGGVTGAVPDNRLGVVCPLLPWSVERISA